MTAAVYPPHTPHSVRVSSVYVPQQHVLDMRAEVAVLTRNVVFQGDASSTTSLFGASIMVSTPASSPSAILQLQDVQMTNVGQANVLGM